MIWFDFRKLACKFFNNSKHKYLRETVKIALLRKWHFWNLQIKFRMELYVYKNVNYKYLARVKHPLGHQVLRFHARGVRWPVLWLRCSCTILVPFESSFPARHFPATQKEDRCYCGFPQYARTCYLLAKQELMMNLALAIVCCSHLCSNFTSFSPSCLPMYDFASHYARTISFFP